MISQEEVLNEEEHIRKLVRALPDDKRYVFYKETEKQLKDPDTYATLNYIFIAGLHHFYLGKWMRGLFNISVFLIGAIMLFTPLAIIGLLLIIAISVIELYALFKSQIIVHAYNNAVMKRIYSEIIKEQGKRQNLS
ncbi:MAG: TM2 domain-containing protein [Burkholderiales bacterium]|nr:TM2 domain-containing protein [Burkholderiales bacterium]MDR4518573.1 TM2 domain-containing protein [Nitrosomonas sp.]